MNIVTLYINSGSFFNRDRTDGKEYIRTKEPKIRMDYLEGYLLSRSKLR